MFSELDIQIEMLTQKEIEASDEAGGKNAAAREIPKDAVLKAV